MSNIVVVSGHPDLDTSNANTVILNALEHRFDSIAVRRLDTLYPDFNIDIEAEQQVLIEADIVVMQFPFHWYSVPALLKKWIDDVLAYNFAFGSKGDKLKGKHLVLSFTIGGPAQSYDPLGYNHFSVAELVKPLQQLGYLTGMIYQPPVYSHGMVYIRDVYNTLEGVQQAAEQHATRLINTLEMLQSDVDIKLNRFVHEWFARFDKLDNDLTFFTRHLSENVRWDTPEGTYSGHAGFYDWYQTILGMFRPDCTHIIEQVDKVTERDGQYQVQLRIRLQAQTYSNETVNLLVNEYWRFTVDEAGKIIISEYQVEPVGQ